MEHLHPKSAARTPGPTITALAALGAVVLAAQVVAADSDPARAAREKALAVDQANLRQTIAGLQPADAALETLAKATAEADKPLLDAAIEARKKAVEAGNAYLAVLVPETDAGEIDVRGDAWLRSQNDLELANLTLAFANERNRMAIARGSEQAAAAVKMPDIIRRDAERLAARKALLEATLRLRVAERNRRTAGREFEESLRTP
jgi:hypothetical protein